MEEIYAEDLTFINPNGFPEIISGYPWSSGYIRMYHGNAYSPTGIQQVTAVIPSTDFPLDGATIQSFVEFFTSSDEGIVNTYGGDPNGKVGFSFDLYQGATPVLSLVTPGLDFVHQTTNTINGTYEQVFVDHTTRSPATPDQIAAFFAAGGALLLTPYNTFYSSFQIYHELRSIRFFGERPPPPANCALMPTEYVRTFDDEGGTLGNNTPGVFPADITVPLTNGYSLYSRGGGTYVNGLTGLGVKRRDDDPYFSGYFFTYISNGNIDYYTDYLRASVDFRLDPVADNPSEPRHSNDTRPLGVQFADPSFSNYGYAIAQIGTGPGYTTDGIGKGMILYIFDATANVDIAYTRIPWNYTGWCKAEIVIDGAVVSIRVWANGTIIQEVTGNIPSGRNMRAQASAGSSLRSLYPGPESMTIDNFTLSICPGIVAQTYRRISPRSDGFAGGSPRNYPKARSIQSGNRTNSGYL